MSELLRYLDIYLSFTTFNNFSVDFKEEQDVGGGSVTRNSLSNFNLWLVILINKGGVVKARNVSLTEAGSN